MLCQKISPFRFAPVEMTGSSAIPNERRRKIDASYNPCLLCPRKCGVDRTKNAGFCGEKSELKIAVACLHFGEEPLITVKGGSGTIFVTGCNLRCAFCQNYQISQKGMGRAVTVEEFSEICLKLQSLGAENINIVTGSHAVPEIVKGLKLAKENGLKIPVCWNSSAYESVETLEMLKDVVDIWLPDLKTLNPNLSKNLFDCEDYGEVAKKAISWMVENFPLVIEPKLSTEPELVIEPVEMTATAIGSTSSPTAPSSGSTGSPTSEKIFRGVIIRHLFLPGRFEETVEVLQWLKENADKKAIISLMNQYTPVPFEEEKTELNRRHARLSEIENRLVTSEEDGDIRDLIEAYDFEYLFYQDLTDDTTWLPDFTREQPFSYKLAKVVWHW